MKVSIIGAGNVGSTCAFELFRKNLTNILMMDKIEGLAEGKALDIAQTSSMLKTDFSINGTSDINKIEDSDVVVITAGMARKPGMSRFDLALVNGRIVKEIIDVVKSRAQSSIIIMVTNPLDIMTRLAYLISGIDRGRIIGMGGILDSVRFKYFISEKLKVKPYDINAYVIGEHGRYMIPLIREAKVNGEKVIEIIDEKDAREIVERTKVAGAEIVSFLKTGSAYFSPSVCAAEIVEVVLNDKNNEYSICCNLEGEFGANNTALNVPAIIGRRGIKKINEIELNEEEVKIFKLAAKEVDEGINVLREEGVL